MLQPTIQPIQLAPWPYEILGRAGRGSSGEVFEGRDLARGERVALKLALGAEGARRLAREAYFAELALSPRLPELVDLGRVVVEEREGRAPALRPAEPREDGRALLVLRWVAGEPLRPGLGDAAARLRIARDLGEALADLHGVGVAHGDVKPENVIVGPAGEASLLDLGAARHAWELEADGATPRYLARGDREIGDGRARDLVALGALLAELALPELARKPDLVAAARRARIPGALGEICAALLAPSPGSRPEAGWVADRASAALASLGDPRALPAEREARGERHARLVRATYLRVRAAEIEGGASASADAAPWLGEALARARRVRALLPGLPGGPEAGGGAELGPLSAEETARWLIALVGDAAAAWPLDAILRVPERERAARWCALAARLPPKAWTLGDVEAASAGGNASPRPSEPLRLDRPEGAARCALALARVPSDPEAIELVEASENAPASLVAAAADALRLRGALGRARALALRLSPVLNPDAESGEAGSAVEDPGALVAEILRRSGDRDLARQVAERALGAGLDASGRAGAALLRLALDAGDAEAASALAAEIRARGEAKAALCEALALYETSRGDVAAALLEVRRGEALARTSEERARLAALRGYALHGTDPRAARKAYAAAVDHAVRAGAVVEEATYRTGEAAAAADLGDVSGAIGTARRAALLWEHLGQPALAARALLAAAAARAMLGAAHEAIRAAREAAARAREGGDLRAEAYAELAVADAASPESAEGRAAACRAAELLDAEARGRAAGPLPAEDAAFRLARWTAALADLEAPGREGAAPPPADVLRVAARLLRHGGLGDGSSAGEDSLLPRLDSLALGERHSLAVAARLDYLGARAALLARPGAELLPADAVLGALLRLAEVPAPLPSRGPALAAACDLAAARGAGEAAGRLLAALGEAAREAARGAGPELEAAARLVPWVARASLPTAEGGLRPAQARELEELVHALGERDRLGPLLLRAVDALVLWTGVERGLLLLSAPDGRLVPRAARNLARADLSGEQLALSQTIARRALEAREPVVAVDAAGEMPSLHHSVHTLKLRSVLAVPLVARGETLGVAYLDDRVRRGAFGPRELSWARTIAALAATAIADARDQVRLRRAARTARRASAKLAEALAAREAALDVAERELERVRTSSGARGAFGAIVGESEAMVSLVKVLGRVAASDVPVLVAGESGSGKELVARAIHAGSARAKGPFVSENCGAIPEGLLESALFGHVRGAFTGADRVRVGLFEAADRGTLFLDEVGEMSLPMQAKLLRVLEDGTVRPLGTERSRKVDVRVVAATHRDLEAMVRARTFREDLFYRLSILPVRIPPLRERASDVPLLVARLIDKHADKRLPRPRVTRAAMDRLVAHSWPGNVRQLENEIRRALVLSDGTIDVGHLSPEVAAGGKPSPERLGLHVRSRVDALEADLVREALEKTGHNQTQAAKLLGLSRFGLQKMMKRLGVE